MKKQTENIGWFRKNREIIIAIGSLLLFILVLALLSVLFSGKNEETQSVIEEEAVFNIPEAAKNQEGSPEKQSSSAGQPSSFYLKPEPAELMTKLEGLSYQEFRQETKDLPGLKIMWPAYFFALDAIDGDTAHVIFDASEDGFGVLLTTSIDIQKYPQILTLKKGTKIWLAAEITGVDPTGTGQFLLNTEYIRFDDYQPPHTPSSAQQNDETE